MQIDLSMTPIGVEGGLALAYALQQNAALLKNLTLLNLSNSAIGTSAAGEMLKTLSHAPKLESLDLSWNWLSEKIISLGAGQLMRMAKELRVLRLRWNGITDVGAKHIAAGLSSSSSLTELDLGGNWLKSKGAARMATSLNRHPSLQSFRLDHNAIGSSGAKELASALRGKSKLARLDISGNEIGNEGAREIASVLRAPTALSRLELRLNEKNSDSGAKSFADALLHGDTTLAYLDLGGNAISDAGAAALAHAATSNSNMRECWLDDNAPTRRGGGQSGASARIFRDRWQQC
jgi:Ran GTPase-activating protein (RanGAP) involved in mRNA processing and transport